jgi:hypothetical protein
MPLIVERNTSTRMFYLLKNFLLLILVIIKVKCNTLILNEIRVLKASYVCHALSLHMCVCPIWILEDGPLISEVVLSQLVSELDRG